MISSILKQAVCSGHLSKKRDRFQDYHEYKSLEERFQMVTQIEGLNGIEIVHPYVANDATELKDLIQKYKVDVSAINANIKQETEFMNGGITSPEKKVREKAIQFIKNAKKFAQETGVNKVTCCPLSDGYEFSFNCNYLQKWKYLIDGFGEASEFLPEIPLFIEYKPNESRGRCFLDTASKTLLLLKEIGSKSMGVTIDFGHSLYGNENPAEALSLVVENDFPFYIHINDNDGKWDWDWMVGTKHLLDYIEFIFYLQEYNYKDFITSDTSPTRWDIKESLEINTRLTNKIWSLLENIDREKFKKLISSDNFIKIWDFIENKIIKI